MRCSRLAGVSRGFFVSLALSLSGAAMAADQPPTLTIGSALPAFSLPGIDGKTYSDQSFKGDNILVLIFTCAHCPTAQAYQERIDGIAQLHGALVACLG